MTGIELITKERQEQLEKHGFSVDHDFNTYVNGELVILATALVSSKLDRKNPPIPNFDPKMWNKMASKFFKDRLAIAGALLAAELDLYLYPGDITTVNEDGYVEPSEEQRKNNPGSQFSHSNHHND